jgi:hypothetical protein
MSRGPWEPLPGVGDMVQRPLPPARPLLLPFSVRDDKARLSAGLFEFAAGE